MTTMKGIKPYQTPAEKTWYWVQIAATIIPALALLALLALIGAGVVALT